MKQHNGRIGNLPANINLMNPVPNRDAKSVVRLLRTNGKVSGYELSDGTRLTKSQGVAQWPDQRAGPVPYAHYRPAKLPVLQRCGHSPAIPRNKGRSRWR